MWLYFKNFLQSLSLKTRISLVFGLSTLVLLMLTVFISYFSMSNILTEKLHSAYKSNLKQLKVSIENAIDDMNYVSQQIAFSSNLRNNLLVYLESESPYDRLKHFEELNDELNVITFSNPNIGLSLLYVDSDDRILFKSKGIKNDFDIHHAPLLIEGHNMNNYGPHISQERYKDQYVLSTVRELDLSFPKNIYIYLESKIDITRDIIEIEQHLNNTNYLIINNDQKIIYSENTKFHLNDRFQVNEDGYGKTDGYYWFSENSPKGWSIIALVPMSHYDQAMKQWSILMRYIIILFVCISIIASLFLWKSFHKPLNKFRHEIYLMEKTDFHSEVVKTKIPEFVELTNQFRNMKAQIVRLIKDIENKERDRADLEVEKLIHQINPHFLMNTLDTAKWLAVSGDREELTQLLTSLNKILYYNMGKLGTSSSLQKEIDSMEQYIKLQQIRYDFDYELNINIQNKLMSCPMPRFILQPLVENAIYHGLVDEGKITVTACSNKEHIIIKVSDNGRGMPKEKVDSILKQKDHDESKIGMGIGLNYVKRILHRVYGDLASIEVESELDRGTSVTLMIPLQEGVSSIHD